MNNYNNFPIAKKKGYDPESVDTYIEELNSRIGYLQDQNTILTAKLAEAQEMIEKYSAAEQGLRQSIAQSKVAAADMIIAAKERSDALVNTSRDESCRIIDELDREIEERYKTIENIKQNVLAFKNQLFDLYASHIDAVELMAKTAEKFEYNPDFTQLSVAIDAFEGAGETECPETPEFPKTPEDSFFADADKLEPADFNISDEGALIMEAEKQITEETPEIEFEKAPEEPAYEAEPESPLGDFILGDQIIEEDDDMFEISRDLANEAVADDVLDDDDMFVTGIEEVAENSESANSFIDENDDMFTAATKEDEEYFKFLSDFVNED